MNFIGTMRMMLDAKYRELLLVGNNYKNISRFPDFIYSWFDHFIVDHRTRKIREIDSSE